MTTEIIIPTYRPGKELEELLRRLISQSCPPDSVRLINTEEKYWDPGLENRFYSYACSLGRTCGWSLSHISSREFDHGGTREAAAAASSADIMVFMTQDALPADRHMLEHLINALLRSPEIGAAYARQLPRCDADPIERYAREFNYPPRPVIRSQKDVARYGIKTYFCSNVCAAYNREIFMKLDGFPRKTIFNEDMIYTGRLLQKGYKVAYAADALVLHSHNYTLRQQFRRNFDLGVSQAQFPEIFSEISSEGEGAAMVKKNASRLIRERDYAAVFRLGIQSFSKYSGYWLGKRYQKIPAKIIRRLTMNREYWDS